MREIGTNHTAYARDPVNESLYERLQELRRALEAVTAERDEIAARRVELEERIRSAAREEETLAADIARREAALPQLQREWRKRRDEADEAQRAFEEAVEADPEASEIFDSIRRSDEFAAGLVDLAFDIAAERLGEVAPGEERTLIFAVEEEGKLPLLGAAGICGRVKQRIALTRKEDGTFEVVLLLEGDLGGYAGAGIQGELAAVGRYREVYRFDPATSGDMVNMAGMIVAAGLAGPQGLVYLEKIKQGLDLVSDDTIASATLGLAGGFASELLGAAESIAGGLGADDFAEKAASARATVDAFSGTALDMAIAYKHLGRSAGDSLVVRKSSSGGRAEGKVDLEVLQGKLSAERVESTETRWARDASGRRVETAHVEAVEMEVKGEGEIGIGLAGEIGGVYRVEIKRVRPVDPREPPSVEVFLKATGEVGGGTGAGIPVVKARGGAGIQLQSKYVLGDLPPAEIDALERAAIGDPAGFARVLREHGGLEDMSDTRGDLGHARIEADAKVVKVKGKATVLDTSGEFHHEMIFDDDG